MVGMASHRTGSPLDDIAYLARSEHRAPTLVAVAARPRSRSELWEMTGVSSSTIRRTLGEFEDRNWIRRDGYRFTITPLGAFVATAVADLIERVELESQLRDIWQVLPGEDTGFTIEMCANAVVTVAEPENPYAPINRFQTLLEDTDTVRILGSSLALLEPCREDFCGRVIDGMQADIVDPPSAATYIRTTYPDLSSRTLESGNLTIHLHDDLPGYSVAIFDDRVAIIGHEPGSETVRVLVDTDNASARDWAMETFDRYARQTPTVPLETVLD